MTARSAEPVAVVAVAGSLSPGSTEFLDSLARATDQPLDIVLTINGTAGDVSTGPASSPDLRIVETGSDIAYGRAANLGVYSTTAEFVVVVSPDVQWQAGALDALLAAARRWPKGASFGPLIKTSAGEVYPSARALPSLGRGIGHALCGRWWSTNPWTVGYRLEKRAPVERTAGWLSGSCLLLRRDAFDDVGGFDPDYFRFFEDVDLGERLGRAGWHNVYVPSAVVRHTGVDAVSRDTGWMATEHHRSAWRYLSRRYAGWRWLPVRAALRVGLGTRSAFASRLHSHSPGARPHHREP